MLLKRESWTIGPDSLCDTSPRTACHAASAAAWPQACTYLPTLQVEKEFQNLSSFIALALSYLAETDKDGAALVSKIVVWLAASSNSTEDKLQHRNRERVCVLLHKLAQCIQTKDTVDFSPAVQALAERCYDTIVAVRAAALGALAALLSTTSDDDQVCPQL